MINIITGDIRSGKTTKLISLFEQDKKGDGFACKKVIKNGKFIGYDIIHLQSKKHTSFAYLKKYTSRNWNKKFQFSRFSFSEEGIKFAEKIINSVIKNNVEPIFIDEIGPVEINLKKGFYKLIKVVLNSERECFLTVRNDMIDEFVEVFDVDEFNIIEITPQSSQWSTNDV
ncbi:MAG: nucleoside-triphosphatase [Candidatus Marinimicrobia bacterium]|nr:nucleoside-triphosphatase [Candidatus Neomarinimicrobiota bacterium]